MAKRETTETDAPRFEGFADGKGKFWKALEKNQNREWFAEHKGDYEEGWAKPMVALLRELHARVDAAYPDLDLGDPKVFRIYRDVRFAADKAPYKTHVAGLVPVKRAGAVVELPAALYLQVGATTLAAAGQYAMSGDALTRFRTAVLDDARGAELDKILAKLTKMGMTFDAAESLKRVPKGVDPEHPRAELLKRKGLIATFPEPPANALASRAIVDHLLPLCKAVAPLVRWLAFVTA